MSISFNAAHIIRKTIQHLWFDFYSRKKNVSSVNLWWRNGGKSNTRANAKPSFSYFITFYNGLIKILWISDKHTYKYKHKGSINCVWSIAAARQWVGQNFKIVKSNRHKYFYGSRWWQFLGPSPRTYYYYPVVAFMSHEWTAVTTLARKWLWCYVV